MNILLMLLYTLLTLLSLTKAFIIPLPTVNTPILLEALHNVSNPESSQYGHFWSQQAIDALVQPSEDLVNTIIAPYKKQGYNCIQRGDSLQCTKHTTIKVCSHDAAPPCTGTFDNHPSLFLGAGDGFVGREVMLSLYNITYNTAPNTSLGAIEYQGAPGFNQEDLLVQQQLNGEPVNNVSHVIGTNVGTMIESQLDVQMLSQIAENGTLWFWDTDQWMYAFAVDFLHTPSIPTVISISWGWAEKDQCSAGLGQCYNLTSKEYVSRTNLEFAKMGLRGVTVMVASGDAGAPGRTNELCTPSGGVNPVFPGSSPYVTSVGATYLVPTPIQTPWKTPLCKEFGCVSGTKELPCNFEQTHWTTGGGFGLYNEKRPSWQKNAVEKYLQSSAKMPKNFSRSGRGYPDVSVLGHFCPVVNQNSTLAVDGTSCASPVFAGIVALLNNFQNKRGKPRMGFLNPVLYKMWEDQLFTDITTGNNWCTEEQCCSPEFGYEAAVGWDPVTGVGTPNVGLMMEWLVKHT